VNQVMNKPVDITRLRGALKELLPVTGVPVLQPSSQST
jgi:hypothetical protein